MIAVIGAVKMCEKEAECVEFFLSPERIGNREKKDCTAQRELNIEILITVLQLINKRKIKSKNSIPLLNQAYRRYW